MTSLSAEDRLPEGARTFTVRTPNGALGAVELGTGTAGTALLVPGFTGSKDDFHPLLRPLADAGFRIVAHSQLGQYGSTGPRDPDAYTLDAFAAATLAVAAALAADGSGPVHLLGHSFGGYTARAAALAAPERFRSLTLLCSGPGTGGGDGFRRREQAVAERGPLALWEGGDEPASGRERWLHERLRTTSAAHLIGALRIMGTEPDRSEGLRATGLPVLVAHGEHDTAWPPELQREMAGRIGARYAVLPGAGHTPNDERPQETAGLLAGFWSDCPVIPAPRR